MSVQSRRESIPTAWAQVQIPPPDATKKGAQRRSSLLALLLTARRTELELDPHRQLRLSRIADAHAQEAVEVEQLRRGQRVHVVGVAEGVEHFQLRHECEPFADAEPARHAEVEGEERIVLAQMVAAAIDHAAASIGHEARDRILLAARRARAGA